MPKHGKRYVANAEKIERRPLTVAEAVDQLKQCQPAKFDESIEVVLKLNVDTRKADQIVRGTVVLPRGTGKQVRVIVFAEGQPAEQAGAAGADEIGGEELAKKVQDGWLNFDVALAHPAMMKHVGKLGKILGPRGLMPSPKSGTVTPNLPDAVKEFKAGKVEFRTDEGGNVHAMVGKASFAPEALVENVTAFIEAVRNLRPAAVKGAFIEKAVVSSTMGPGLQLAV